MLEDYEHSIFISYRWLTPTWRNWVRTIFIPVLEDVLKPTSLDLNKYPIWWDDAEQKPGMKWPKELATKLANSKIMIALLCENYFVTGSWCLWEYEFMRRREENHATQILKKPLGLIIPIIIQDGADLDDDIHQRCPINLVKPRLANPWTTDKSPKCAELFDLLSEKLDPILPTAIASVPKYDPTWQNIGITEIELRLRQREEKSQETPPSLNPDQQPIDPPDSPATDQNDEPQEGPYQDE